LALAATDSIVGLTVVLDVEKAFHPLQEFKVILIFCLDQLVNIDVPLDVILLESLL
jgi:hypothetical protein